MMRFGLLETCGTPAFGEPHSSCARSSASRRRGLVSRCAWMHIKMDHDLTAGGAVNTHSTWPRHIGRGAINRTSSKAFSIERIALTSPGASIVAAIFSSFIAP